MNLMASMRYLLALNQHRHFGRAAQACHITQPALSNALRALEEEFGVVIVQRGRNYAGLTAEGERVLAAAQRMVREHEILQQDLGSGMRGASGVLRIGAVPTAMPIVARFAAMVHARHPDVRPSVRSMSSQDIEAELEGLTLDMGLGYTERLARPSGVPMRIDQLPQYTESYYLLRRAAVASPRLVIGPPVAWHAASLLPLCLLTPDMHNRAIVDRSFAAAGASVQPVIQTNSILTLALSVVVGQVCSILPGALVDAVRGYASLEACPLVAPDVDTPIGFMVQVGTPPSRVVEAALSMARTDDWLRHAAEHSGTFVD